jgi:hypothetical protein
MSFVKYLFDLRSTTLMRTYSAIADISLYGQIFLFAISHVRRAQKQNRSNTDKNNFELCQVLLYYGHPPKIKTMELSRTYYTTKLK